LALHFAYLAPWFDVPWLSPVYWSLAIGPSFAAISYSLYPIHVPIGRRC
jgi:hypothetical protein